MGPKALGGGGVWLHDENSINKVNVTPRGKCKKCFFMKYNLNVCWANLIKIEY